MAKNTSIVLGDHFDSFINEELASGRFSSVSEVIRKALRLLETEEQKVKKLRTELDAGENSKMVYDFNHETHLAPLRSKHK